MNAMKKISLFSLLLTCSTISYAEVIPPPSSNLDSRLRIMDYTRDVIEIKSFVGTASHIQFSEGEEVLFIAAGDKEAWEIASKLNNVYLKPKTNKYGDTNLIITTNKYTYNFSLIILPFENEEEFEALRKSPDLVYGLQFRYPLEEQAKLAAEQKEKERLAKLEREARLERNRQYQANKALSSSRSAKAKKRNIDYWQAGNKSLSPVSAEDDGRMTYLTFKDAQAIPSIYYVDEDGKENIVNTTVEGNTVIVHGVYELLRLRRGAQVLCVKNYGDDIEFTNKTGTVSDRVIRATRVP